MNDPQRVRRAPRPGGARRRPPGEDDDFEMEGPRRKKNTVSMNPVVAIIVLFVVPGIFLGIFLMAWMKRGEKIAERGEAVVVEDDQAEFKALKKRMKRAHELYRTALLNGREPEYPREKLAIDQQNAIDYIGMLKGEFGDLLDQYRNEDGDLPKEYSGYQTELRQLNTWLHDLLKSKSF